jgi:RNA polymerase subunit RPABC4/transcription elongation factor Spt4
MPEPTSQTPSPQATAPDDLPAGDHPLEVAARAGIGPLSAMSQKVWHGEAIPCVSCGQLVRRNSAQCDSCGQDLTDEMIARMRKHAGPWYVLEHLRPFPGVSIERILLQVRRGLITSTSIVRGPATDYQWRFAVETPGLCRLYGRCWNCFHGIKETEPYCPACLSYLGFEKPAAATNAVATAPTPPTQNATTTTSPGRPAVSQPAQNQTNATSHLDALATAAQQAHQSQPRALDEPPRVGPVRAGWIALAVVIFVLACLVWYTTVRSGETPHASSSKQTTTATTPTSE